MKKPHATARSEAAPGRDAALVLVDFDDTLVDTAPRFQNARRAFVSLLAGLGFAETEIRRVHQDEVEPEMLRAHGLGPFRLGPSFAETYRRLCAGAGLPPETRVEEECRAIARAVVGAPPCLDGAMEALAELAAAVPTVLYTQAADADYQLSCIREAGVLDVLPAERVRICARKTPGEFRAALARYGVEDPAAAWMVGNSMRSDVNPALVCGARAILVECADPWSYDEAEPVAGGFVRVPTFAAAVRHLLGAA